MRKSYLSMNQILRIALISFLLLNISCLDDGTDCSSSGSQYIDVQGVSGTNVAIGNSFSDFILLGEGIAVSYLEFGIRATPDVVYNSEIASYGGFNAYACSPIPPQPTEKISEIAVFSSAKYAQLTSSKVFAAGDALNAIFKIYEPYSGRIVGLPDFFVGDSPVASDQSFTLQLTAAPSEPSTQQFTIHYRLENGEFYQFTTDVVTITP